MLVPIQLVKADRWVEVARFEGDRTTINYTKAATYTEPFTIDHYEWHIKWEYKPGNISPIVHYFEVYVYRQGETENYVAHIIAPQDGYFGTFPVYNETGTFYMKITFGIVESYSLVVEQNLDSVLVTPTPMASPTPTTSDTANNSPWSLPTELIYVIAVIAVTILIVIAIFLLKRERGH